MIEQPFIVDQAETLRKMVGPRTSFPVFDRPSVISVLSGKGGVGKSTVALNLALAATERGKKILLVDADPNLGNLDVMLGVSPRYRLGDVLRNDVDVEDAVFTPFPGLHVLAGNSGDASYPLYDQGQHDRLFDRLLATEEKVDAVVVDSGAGLHRENLHVARRSDEVFVMSTVEPSSVLDSYATIKMLVRNDVEARISFVINQVRTPLEGDETAHKLMRAVNHFLHIEPRYAGFIPFDGNITTSVMDQQPILRRFPSSAASLSLRKLSYSCLVERMPRIANTDKVSA